MQRSFLWYLGAKPHLAPLAAELVTLSQIRRVVEPFCGSCSFSLNVDAPDYLLGDASLPLVNTLQRVVGDVESFLREARPLFTAQRYTPEGFRQLRDEINAEGTTLRAAALYLAINKYGFNGLWRVNSAGLCNVPMGKPSKAVAQPYFPEDELRFFAARFRPVQISFADWRDTLAQAGTGDLVYADPPYAPITANACHDGYTARPFTVYDHQDLARALGEAAGRGAWVLASNHDTEWVRGLYREASEVKSLAAPRTVNCQTDGRGSVQEILALWRPQTQYEWRASRAA